MPLKLARARFGIPALKPTRSSKNGTVNHRSSAANSSPTSGKGHLSPVPSDGAATNGTPRRRVWFVNQYAMTPDLPGINRHYELGWLLGRHGWEATVFATALHHTSGKFRRGVHIWRPLLWENHDGVRFGWLYSTPYRKNNWRRYVNMLSFMSAFAGISLFAQRPDVVIGSSPHLLSGLGAWVAARRHRVPFLFEVRDVWPDMLVQLGLTTPAVIKPLTLIERFLYRKADRVIALTDGIADRIVAKGVPAEKVIVIPNSLLPAPELDEQRRRARRRELGWQGKVTAVWAGSHNPMNGLDVVVEAARILQDDRSISIVFIGDGSLKQDLISQARDLPNVTFLDPLPKSEIGDFLRAADIGLLHSRRFDAFTGARPNKLFEYMSAGLPIVSTVPGEAWRLIAEAEAGVQAEWENPQALAAAIKLLAVDMERRQEMGRRGFDYVRRAHDRETHVAKLAALLDQLAPLPHPSLTSPTPIDVGAGSSPVLTAVGGHD
jgi:glycosyltransferase involved in cell wall biosynthesis